jgi:hypothetical protein
MCYTQVMNLPMTTAEAKDLVVPLYEDRRDKMGRPEWYHIENVARGVGHDARPVAILHDAVEDGLLSFRQIYYRMSLVQFEAMLLITRDDMLSYSAYIHNILVHYEKGDPAAKLAREVKLSDLRDNMTRTCPGSMRGMQQEGGRWYRAYQVLAGKDPDFV